MFCFPGQQRKERGKSSGGIRDFSQSVSALNHLTVPAVTTGLGSMCHSDTNIPNSFSLLKSAVKIKTILTRRSDCLEEDVRKRGGSVPKLCTSVSGLQRVFVPELCLDPGSVENDETCPGGKVFEANVEVLDDTSVSPSEANEDATPIPFEVKAEISFIDGDESSVRNFLVSEPKPCFNEVAAENVEDDNCQLETSTAECQPKSDNLVVSLPDCILQSRNSSKIAKNLEDSFEVADVDLSSAGDCASGDNDAPSRSRPKDLNCCGNGLSLPGAVSSLLQQVDETGGMASSSGNSSSSDGIAPMASPERSSPPESGVCSPVLIEPPDVSPCVRARYQLLSEGDVQICRLNHERTIVSKVLSSKFLRRWENHHVILTDIHITSRTPTGFLEQPIPYSTVHDVYGVQRWDNKFCIRIVLPDGSLLLQAGSAFVRDQWEHSVKWKRSMHKYRCILRKSSRPEVILKEIKNVVEFSLTSPVQDESALSVPISIISSLLDEKELWEDRGRRDEVIEAMAPLLENTSPTAEMCHFFSNHCILHPRSPVVSSTFTPIVHRILKRNVDFGKSPYMRRFIADFLRAIHSQNNGDDAVHSFVMGVHGTGVVCCPHPRVLPNLVAASLAAIFTQYEHQRIRATNNETDHSAMAVNQSDLQQIGCYLILLQAISELEDWRAGLAGLLQPVPVPDEALSSSAIVSGLAPTIHRIGTDSRCSVHSMVLGVRAGKEGWLHVFCPSSPGCHDGGIIWCQILENLVRCCCRRKNFLGELAKQVGALQLVALRDQAIAQDLLCLMLEWELLASEEQQLQVVTTLQSTPAGKVKYRQLCDRQDHLRQLQQKGGPRKLTLPSRSTDADVAKLLSGGSFGNLECLSLAFTHVTSACAQYLIQLPSLRYLNLWATQFGDLGLQTIADHLNRLQVLNLCETQVTDRGIASIGGMTSLKKLNLNSTKLSVETLEKLKADLPSLQELDIRYTDAW